MSAVHKAWQAREAKLCAATFANKATQRSARVNPARDGRGFVVCCYAAGALDVVRFVNTEAEALEGARVFVGIQS